MVSVLHGLGYIAIFATFLFVTLSLASGLLWLSEVIEEHSTTAKVVGTRTIYVVIILHVLLWLIDSFPFPQIAFSILCHCVYLSNFTPSWPLISLTSPSFISSCLLVLTDHFVWFFYFSKRTHAARYGHANWKPPQGALTFAEISTFFGVCVWLVPLFLFLSLSANDNALPVSHGTLDGVHSASL
ncbi:transmembrane adaptor Erv26 [Cantharellus anzutake]|uniref:transmembrane adaptor Erv26 n=1 Tax=Cantharellus anzutake TaxID=1750568 RepID=UPI0019058CF9|nr:transmembrane adaptor Erv26 [Cantharellus anzutake]KAF8341245.1 transmembrane adaptor Erv26 [Cantharellus anzutake]